MYEAKFTRLLSFAMEKTVFNRLKVITDKERISMSNFVRDAVEKAVSEAEQKDGGNKS
jgi:hypothetical protein